MKQTIRLTESDLRMIVSEAVTGILAENRFADRFKSFFNGGKKEELSDEDKQKLDWLGGVLKKLGITDLEQGRIKGEPGFYFWNNTRDMAKIGKVLDRMDIGVANVGGGDREPDEAGSMFTKYFAKVGPFRTIYNQMCR